jgi:Zn-dependent protease
MLPQPMNDTQEPSSPAPGAPEPRLWTQGGSQPYRMPAPMLPKPARGIWGTLAAGFALLLTKGKYLLLLLKAMPFAKFFLSSGSMLLYIWVYAARYGALYAIGFVLLLLCHELGHAAVIRKHGIKAGWPIFVPFFGAMIALKERPLTADADADISYGGPLWGTIASFAVAGLYLVTRNPLFLAVGSTGFYLNMFNLTPLRPLDGGAIAEVFSRKARILGVLVVLGLFISSPASPALIMLLLAIPRAFSKTERYAPEELTSELRTKWALRYFGLLLFLGAGLYFSRQLLAQAS